MMKRCGTCHVDLPLDQFSLRRASRDGLQSRCRQCWAADYLANADERKAAAAAGAVRTARRHRERLAKYLDEHPCVDCGEADLRCLDFDHREPADKLSNVSALVWTHARWERVLAEIAKCDVRCANCHRKRTGAQRNDWRHQIRSAEMAAETEFVTARLRSLFSHGVA